ncbi:MAG: flippase-like domain-containing protein [Clostridia bacterium]|nr:flippase-like domain-containing protein [Clostridia bacterium]
MKASTRKLLSIVFLFVTLGLVLFIGFSETDVVDLWGALQKLSWASLLLCLPGWIGYVLADSVSIYHFFRRQGHPLSFWYSIRISVIGIYYCNITPGASGGQPMQIYYLKKANVPIGVSGSALTVKFFCFQLTLLVVGAILWFTHAEYVTGHLQGVIWVILLGYVINFFSIGILLVMAINKQAVRSIITLCIRIGVRIRLCKDPEKSTKKWEAHCASFLSSVQMIRDNPFDLLVQFLIALVQLLSLMMTIPLIYHAFGLSGTSLMEQLTMGVLLYISASYTPLPGASGAQEGGFAVFFQGIFPSGYLFVALLVWRFCTYYISLIVGVLLTIGQGLFSSLRGKSLPKNKG